MMSERVTFLTVTAVCITALWAITFIYSGGAGFVSTCMSVIWLLVLMSDE